MRIDNDLSGYSILSAIIGFISLFLWLIPIISVFSSLFTIYAGIKGYNSERGGLSKVGILFGVIGFTLTFIRSWFVYGAM
jgi:hypothetical protein